MHIADFDDMPTQNVCVLIEFFFLYNFVPPGKNIFVAIAFLIVMMNLGNFTITVETLRENKRWLIDLSCKFIVSHKKIFAFYVNIAPDYR